MIAYVRGVLAEKEPTRVVVEAAGVGYEVLRPLSTYDRLPREGRPISLQSDIGELYERRRPFYERFADLSISNDGTPAETVRAIMDKL